jgi:hypothetical protein
VKTAADLLAKLQELVADFKQPELRMWINHKENALDFYWGDGTACIQASPYRIPLDQLDCVQTTCVSIP